MSEKDKKEKNPSPPLPDKKIKGIIRKSRKKSESDETV